MDTKTDIAPKPEDVAAEKRHETWRAAFARSNKFIADHVPDWTTNVDYRRGKPFSTSSSDHRVQVPIDWAATKAKQAQLFSQVPEVRLKPTHEKYRAAMTTFAKKVNKQLSLSRVGVAMDECMPDCINASGIAGVLVSYEAKTQKKSVPIPTPLQVQQLKAMGQEVPMQDVDEVVDSRFPITRLSPADIRFALEFTGSDFDDSPWVGNVGRKQWANAKSLWPKLTDADKDAVCGGEGRKTNERISNNEDVSPDNDVVSYEQIFYRRHLFHEDELSFDAIHHLVFVKGKNEPVVDEPWKGQKRTASGKVVGALKYPIRFETLTYITDDAIPPSDSAMGRPQTNELNESRSQMVRNRKTSVPLRGFDTNRVDPAIQVALMRGTWQGMIPTNGPGDKAIWEVARASYPQEDYELDRIVKADVRETWQVEDAINGGPAIRSATEANNRQQNFQTRIGYERGRTATFFVGIAEVLAGLVALYGVFDEEETAALQAWNREELANCYVYDVRADSTLLLDATQRMERNSSLLNMTAKSGVADIVPVVREMYELAGHDPELVQPQQPGGPDPASFSFRVTAEDMNNPLVLAMLIRTQQAPTAEEMNKAKLLIASVAAQPTAEQPPAPQAPPPPGAPPVQPVNEDYNTASRVEKRAEDGK